MVIITHITFDSDILILSYDNAEDIMHCSINVKIIVDYIKNNNMTKTAFCKTCKISVSTLNRVLAGENVKLISLAKIAKAINIQLYKLFLP